MAQLDELASWGYNPKDVNLSFKWMVVLMTIGGWALGVSIYGYFWVSGCLADPGCRDYEGIWILPLSGFTIYQVPILLIGLVVLVFLEVLLIPHGRSANRVTQ